MPNGINATTKLMTTPVVPSTEKTAQTLRMITVSLLPLRRAMAFNALLSAPDCSNKLTAPPVKRIKKIIGADFTIPSAIKVNNVPGPTPLRATG